MSDDYPLSQWPHGLTLEVKTQDPADQSFRLDRSPLDLAQLRGGAADLFVLDTSTLGTGTLGPPPPPMIWWDITGPTLEVATTVGVRQDSALVKPETGTLTATIKNAPNLIAAGVHTGTAIRLRRADLALWSGRIEDIDTKWDKEGGSTTTITASDWLTSASRITRHGRQIDRETALDRFCALLWESLDEPIPTVHYWGNTAWVGARPVCPVLDDASLTDHLQMAANSGNFIWAPLPSLEASDVILRPRLYSTPGEFALWSDLPDAPRSYLSVDEGSATSQIINTLDITQHAVSTDSGDPQAATTTHTFTNAASVANWGTRSASADISVALDSDIEYAAQELLTINRAVTTTITAMTIWGADWATAITGHPLNLHPLSAVPVRLRGVTHHLLVASVSHAITAKRWTTTLTFIRRT